MVGIAMVTSNPVGCGDDVDAGFEHPFVQVDVWKHAVEGDAVGLRGDDGVDGARRHHTDRVHADDLAGVPADLVR